MIGFAETIGTAQKWIGGHITKPGYGDPKPPKPVRNYDPPEVMEMCLNCPVEGGCDMTSKACPLRRNRGDKRAAEIAERDEKVFKLIKSGWINIDAICEELGISRNIYFSTKKRLKGKGII